MNITRKEFIRIAAQGFALAPLLGCAREERREVNFFNWSKYIGKDTLPGFTRATGIPVNYEEFADEEEMFAKLRSGARGYDLIIATDYMMERLKALNIIDPIPTGVLTHQGNIEPTFRNPPYDPSGAYAVPYLWGTTGIGYNKAKLAKPPTSWKDLWDERHSGRISMLDNSRDCVSTALLMTGYLETTKDPAAFEDVRKLLLKQKPLVKQYSSSTYMDGLVAGEIHIAMAWSGDVLQVAKENPNIDYIIPREGSYMWVDNLCLVRGSRHLEDALRLLDHLIDGPVAGEIANAVRYASPNSAARPYLDPAIAKDTRVFPSKEMAKRLRFHNLLDSESTQLWNEAWSDVKVS